MKLSLMIRRAFHVTCFAAMLLNGIAYSQDRNVVTQEAATVATNVATIKTAQKKPAGLKVAVTDLSYEEKVAQNFVKYDASTSMSANQNAAGGGGGFTGNTQTQSQAVTHLETGTETVINRGELRKFVSDIKGQLIKSGRIKVIQGKPWVKKDTDTLYDIIARVKDDYYANADYVLFGSISSVDIRRESNQIQNSTAVTHSLSYEMMAEFSLINTKTFEVVASFSARGEGADTRLRNSNDGVLMLSRTKALSAMSRSLADSVASEIFAQLNVADKDEPDETSGK